MSRARVAGLAALLLTACSDGADEPAAPDSSLVEALVDLHLADARAETTGEDRDSLRTAALRPHGLDSAAVQRTLRELAEQPEDAALLYQQVADRLSAERAGD